MSSTDSDNAKRSGQQPRRNRPLSDESGATARSAEVGKLASSSDEGRDKRPGSSCEEGSTRRSGRRESTRGASRSSSEESQGNKV